MCSCGGLLTDWCYDCGDETCPHCGCPADHDEARGGCSCAGDPTSWCFDCDDYACGDDCGCQSEREAVDA